VLGTLRPLSLRTSDPADPVNLNPMITISHDSQLDGVTLEEVLDTLGVKKNLTDVERMKVCIIEDINKMLVKINSMLKMSESGLKSKDFDFLYDRSIKDLETLQEVVANDLMYINYQHGLSGQERLQGADF